MSFQSSSNLWRLKILTSYQGVEAILNLLESLHLETLSWHECENSPPSDLEDDQGFPIAEKFIVDGYSKTQPDLKIIEQELQTLAIFLNIEQPKIEVCQPVDHQDWLQLCYQQLAPREVGSYLVYGSHDQDVTIPKNLIPLQIDAATAFGSGEHQTTSGCLIAISDLSQNHQFEKFRLPLKIVPVRQVQGAYATQKRSVYEVHEHSSSGATQQLSAGVEFQKMSILDMGCGSGILAIAAIKAWPSAKVIAADNDPESVRVSAYNCDLNNVEIECLQSDGFENLTIREHSSYNLIIANILAKPLCHMAKDMRETLAPKGFIILSGLLERQQGMVLEQYQALNLDLVKVYNIENWTTLVLQAA